MDGSGTHAVVLELFCGTAGLSASLKKLGFDVIAVDKLVSRSPKVMVTKLDLTKHETQQLVLDWIRLPQVKAVFLAPPCGTASKARTIQLEGEQNLPRPLRTWEQPDGVDDLTGWEFLRIEQSNILYDFVATCYNLCCLLGKLFVCENPRDSLFWQVTPWRERDFQDLEHEQVHQACAYGSTRPKWTKLVANFAEIHRIDKICPGNHKHEPWGVQRQGAHRVFATSLEVHYPGQLCATIAETIALALLHRNITPKTFPSSTQSARAFANEQSGTNKVPTFLPEYKTKFVTVWQDLQQIWPQHALHLDTSKLLHDIQVGGSDIQQLSSNLTEQCELKGLHVFLDIHVLSATVTIFPCTVQLKIYGIFWEAEDFVQRAILAQHPLDAELAVPTELRSALQFNLEMADHEMIEFRANFLAKWLSMAKTLAEDEMALKRSMDPCVASAVSNKRILLFKAMLEETQFPDLQVVDELQQGASLTGQVPPTGMLPGKFSPAISTVEEVCDNACRIRPMLAKESLSSGDPHVDEVVWQKTMEEVDRGWLLGPLPPGEVPDNQPISRRFGLRQKRGKIRLIDDYTESGVNTCVTSVESPVLHTIDVACALIALWFNMCGERGLNPELVARTFDLTSAYRQVALNKEGRRFACIRVFDPKGKCSKFFRSLVLPFGAIRSVHAFLRLARAIWWIGSIGCRLLWTSFYDDYISLCKPSLSSCTETTISSLFKLLGWAFAEDGDKCLPYASICEALGVMFDLKGSHAGSALVCNTANRVSELCGDIQEVLDSKTLSAKQAQRLRGRMQFAESQLFGRTGRRCMKVLGAFAEGYKQKLGTKDMFFLSLFKQLLLENVPREIRALNQGNVTVFTDACYERDDEHWPCGLGGVVCFCGQVQYFSLPVDKKGRDILGEHCKKQIIFEAETLAALTAFFLWHELFQGQRCLIFVDNEGTKFSLLKGSSDNDTVDLLAGYFAELEAKVHSFTWIARVPSKSNIADPPSRNETNLEFFRRATEVSTKAKSCLDSLLTRLLKDGETGLATSHVSKRRICIEL
jgi:hypothetical protein